MLSGLHSTARQQAPAITAAKRLRPAHAAQPAGQNPFACQIAVIVLAPCLDKGFIGALHDALLPM